MDAKYEVIICYGSKVMAKVKVLEVKGHGHGHKVKTFGMIRKASSHGMYIWNMKALTQIVQKLWQN